MKINHQFALMLSAFILIPFLVLVISIGVRFSYFDRAQNVPGYDEMTHYLGSIDPKDWENLQKFLEHRPSEIDLVIFNDKNVVAFSSYPDFRQGQIVPPQDLAQYILGQTSQYGFTLDHPREFKNGFVLGRFPPKHMPPGRLIGILDDSTLFLAILLAIASIGISLVARNITKSIMRLETATRRVAGGDLEFSIQVAGNQEIRSLAASVEHMRLTLKEELARRGRFVMGISHDLKSPLALARAYVEAIHDGVYDNESERQRYFSITVNKLDQLDGLIDDMIDFVRLDTGAWKAKLEPVDLKAFLEGFAKGMVHDAEVFAKRFQTDFRISAGLSIPMDSRLIQRSLENLVGNALRHTGIGSVVTLSCFQDGPQAIIAVRDNGQGIAPDVLGHIFEPFFRGTPSRQEPGMGIGLPTVKTLVEAHGWTIDARSSPGETVFSIRIPLSA